MYCSRIALNSSWPAVSRTRTEETKVFNYCEGPVAAGPTMCPVAFLPLLGLLKDCKDVVKSRWTDKGVSVPDLTCPCMPKLGAGEDDTLDLICLFQYQIQIIEFGELLLWQDTAQSISQPSQLSPLPEKKTQDWKIS